MNIFYIILLISLVLNLYLIVKLCILTRWYYRRLSDLNAFFSERLNDCLQFWLLSNRDYNCIERRLKKIEGLVLASLKKKK